MVLTDAYKEQLHDWSVPAGSDGNAAVREPSRVGSWRVWPEAGSALELLAVVVD